MDNFVQLINDIGIGKFLGCLAVIALFGYFIFVGVKKKDKSDSNNSSNSNNTGS